jgi:hypothetical protein
MAVDIQDILKQLEQGITNIAQSSLKNYLSQAQVDGKSFLAAIEDDLTNWTNLLAAGQLSADDFKDLVAGQKDLMQMVALTQAGVAAIQLDQFKQEVFGLVINTVMSALKML